MGMTKSPLRSLAFLLVSFSIPPLGEHFYCETNLESQSLRSQHSDLPLQTDVGPGGGRPGGGRPGGFGNGGQGRPGGFGQGNNGGFGGQGRPGGFGQGNNGGFGQGQGRPGGFGQGNNGRPALG